MNVLISGAGPAGLTMAYWLKRYGYTPTIVERAFKLPIGGYKIDVRGSALQVLKRMGIMDEVISASTQMKKAVLVDKNGNVINEMSGDDFGHRVGEDIEIIRGDLCRILMAHVPDIEFIFGDYIEDIKNEPQRVQVTFNKSLPRQFDLVIGADGIHSKIRQLIFGDEKKFLYPLGLYLCIFSLPNYLDLDRVEMEYSELGRIASVWSTHGQSNMKACFGFTNPTQEEIDLKNKNEAIHLLQEVYKGIGWEVPRFLEMIPEADDFYFDLAALIRMDSWTLGRVALVGDAGYCPSPMSGQGTSLALIGAYVLAGELAKAKGNYKSAFANYEKELRDYVKCNQALGLKSAKLMRSQEKNNLKSYLLKQLMRVMPGKAIQFFVNRATRRIAKAANAINLKNYE